MLVYLLNNKYENQRVIATSLNFSLGKINLLLNELQNKKYIDNEYKVTVDGKTALKPYKVDNAVIMAAGMSSRFAPLSYEKPKGVLVVKCEVLIERQIRQLQEAGIKDITVVVGYMKEKFFYLEEKFGVDIVINEDYYHYNNTSTLIRVLDKLKNTYICSSDDYFSENVFEKYVYDSYYSATYFEGKSNEWGIRTDNKGLIIGVNHRPEDMYCMLGHVYFSHDFSKKFSRILQEQYDLPETKSELWESLFEKNIKELPMYIRKYPKEAILEFDSLEELREFDDKYLENSGSNIFKNICTVLKCNESDIKDIVAIKQGLTNLSFKFSVDENDYVYRHPGSGTEKYISRKSEYFSMKVAKDLGLDKTIIYMDSEKGWKISKFIKNARMMSYHDETEVKNALGMAKKLHDAKIHSDFDFDIWKKTQDLIDKTIASHKDFEDFEELYNNVSKLYELTKTDHVEHVLCHCDCYNPNFLIDENNEMTLIDWEYSGNDDPANDLGTFICCSDYSYEESLGVIETYYGRKPTSKELRHNLAYVAIASYYWFVWAIYQESIGNTVGQYLFLWYKNAKHYMRESEKMYKEEK